ncbi:MULTISPECIES: hypothetical protein [unclassified Chryseobacterium]|uniref:hypothetical protein n=1 Tax=unclassified Chryseobacterium TaxID=2593645 RepID=UPI00300FD4D5
MKNCFYTLLVVIAAIHWSDAETFTPEIGKHQLPASLQVISSDTVKIKESFRENDIAVNEYLTDRLKPIRANFKRINSITQWSSIKKKDIEGESAEGGEAVFYEQKGRLEKITARLYGEMGAGTYRILSI